MSDLTQAIDRISKVEAEIGLAELAREADIPYTTAADWKARGWRPKTVVTLERLLEAAERRSPPGTA